MFQNRLPSRLQYIVAQPGAEQTTKDSVERRLKESLMISELESISDVTGYGKGSVAKLYLLPRAEASGVHRSMRSDWEDRLSGLEGSWSLP